MKKFIMKKIKDEKMKRRHYTLQNIKIADETEDDTVQHSTPNSQINNTNPIIHPEQTPNIIEHDLHSDTFRNTFNYQHQSNTVNKTYDVLATPISTIMTDADVAVYVSINVAEEVSQTDSSHKIASIKQLDRSKSQSLTELNSQHAADKDLIPMSASEVLPCTSINEYGETDSDQHPKDKSKQQYSCNDCLQSFEDLRHLQRHIRNHTDRQPVKCQDPKPMSASEVLPCTSIHEYGETDSDQHPKYKSKQHSCNNCSLSFDFASKLKRHNITHTGERPFKCDYCNKSFSQKCNLEVHKKRKHTNDISIYKFPCSYKGCAKSFKSNPELKIHMTTHTGEKPFKCKYGNESFSQNSHIKAHEQTIHKNDISIYKFPCSYKDCAKSFKSNYELKMHMRIHTGEKPFKCGYCNKSFSQKSNAKAHARRIHQKDISIYKFPCSYKGCAKSFTSNYALKRHMRTHTGERPYNCNNCNKSFSYKSTLKEHEQRMHKNDISIYKFPCSYKDCKMLFIHKCELNIHIRSHTGEKPYICDYCNKSFSQKINLRRHIEIHIRNKLYTRTACPMKFDGEGDLK